MDLQVEILDLQRRLQLRVSTSFGVSAAERAARLAAGRRALEIEDLPIDWAEARLASRHVADILHRHDILERVDYRRLTDAIRHDAGLTEAATSWYNETAGHPRTPRPPMLDEVLTLAFRPFLVRAVEVAERDLDLRLWRRPSCPFCGAWPDFAVYLDDDRRQLICSRCTGRWEWDAVGCPWCELRDPRQLPSFLSADRRYRICACDSCRRYLKAYNARGATRPVLPVVDAIATLPLDAAASQRGYIGG